MVVNNNINNQTLSEKDLGLIREYVHRYKYKTNKPSRTSLNYYVFPDYSSRNYYYPSCRNYYWNRPSNALCSSRSSKKENETNYVLWIAISALGLAVIYLISSLPNLYVIGQKYYLTKKIKQLACKTSDNPHEMVVINNLKALVAADKSTQFLRTQNINTLTALGIITASGTYIASTMGNVAQYVDNFARGSLPSFMQPSDSSLSRTIKTLSNENLIFFAAATAIGSVSLIALNGAYNLYQNFSYNIENPQMYLHRKSVEIEVSLNNLEYGIANSTFKNFLLRTLNFSIYL